LQLRINDRVKVIDEDFEGKVISVQAELVIIECQDGFEYNYSIFDLLRIGEDGKSEHKVRPIKEGVDNKTKPKYQSAKIEFSSQKPIIDLHLEVLCPNESFHSNHEALTYQINCCKETIELAIRKRIRNLIFIHGVGVGKLKTELRVMLRDNYPNIEFFDASYNHFGGGATEIIIHRINQL
jgi:hypothetical protein